MSKVTREWSATKSDYLMKEDGQPQAPSPPSGEGWRLVSSIICVDHGRTGVVWYWEREASTKRSS